MEKKDNHIDGVVIKKIVRHQDERGYFAELMKEGEPGYHHIAQTSFARNLPGVIKAFHYHAYPETWVVLYGEALVVIYDSRTTSSTHGITQVIRAGEKNPMVLSIPSDVAHGYKVLGEEPVGMLYHAGEAYDPQKKDQIGLIPFDSPDINFDWNEHYE